MNTSQTQPVYNAIDRLELGRTCDDFLALMEGKRCGLVLNHTSVSRSGRTTLSILEDLGIAITRLFSPEHGLHGVLEGRVGDSSAHDREVFSLYGENRRPTAEMLAAIDWLIFDIQDIGARFYTYSSTMALCLEACAEFGVSMLVLDRANPLGGQRIEGPIVDEELRSFIGHMRVPIVHGMTMGELALWHMQDTRLAVDLHILPVEGWDRGLTWPQTSSVWIPPSPNIPDFESANWYPGICLLEFNDVSVGRGTAWPFQILGAPWLNPAALGRALEEYRGEMGLSWEVIDFTPDRATHEGQLCHGLKFSRPQNAPAFAPVTLGLALIAALHASHPQQFTSELAQKSLTLLGSRKILNYLLANDLAPALDLANADAAEWRRRRGGVLLY